MTSSGKCEYVWYGFKFNVSFTDHHHQFYFYKYGPVLKHAVLWIVLNPTFTYVFWRGKHYGNGGSFQNCFLREVATSTLIFFSNISWVMEWQTWIIRNLISQNVSSYMCFLWILDMILSYNMLIFIIFIKTVLFVDMTV